MTDTFSIPEPPKNLIAVRDKEGDIWHRCGKNDWACPSADGFSDAWGDLLSRYGPLEAVEYKKGPPNEYDLINKIRECFDGVSPLAPEKIENTYSANLIVILRDFIQELKDYYGIED